MKCANCEAAGTAVRVEPASERDRPSIPVDTNSLRALLRLARLQGDVFIPKASADGDDWTVMLLCDEHRGSEGEGHDPEDALASAIAGVRR